MSGRLIERAGGRDRQPGRAECCRQWAESGRRREGLSRRRREGLSGKGEGGIKGRALISLGKEATQGLEFREEGVAGIPGRVDLIGE